MRLPILLLAVWALSGSAPCIGSTSPAVDPAQEPDSVETAATEGETPAEGEIDPCRPEGKGTEWLDIVQLGIFRTVCSSARWFDGFFGDARFDAEAEETRGYLGVDTIYDEHDSLEAKVRFRAEVEFPNLDHRINAFLGRENKEDFVSGRPDGSESLPQFFRADDREWLVGLGYHPVRGRGPSKYRLDFQAGVEVRFPLEPFVQGRLSRYWFLSDTRLVRFRNIVFWRNQRGFGDTATVDVEQALGQPFLLRWSTSNTFSETTDGLDWYSSLTLYQRLGGIRAMAYTAYVDGETDAVVPLERYGLRAVYRQRMFRKWFYGQLIGGVNFPRDPGESRETSWELGVGVEIRYGRTSRDR